MPFYIEIIGHINIWHRLSYLSTHSSTFNKSEISPSGHECVQIHTVHMNVTYYGSNLKEYYGYSLRATRHVQLLHYACSIFHVRVPASCVCSSSVY